MFWSLWSFLLTTQPCSVCLVGTNHAHNISGSLLIPSNEWTALPSSVNLEKMTNFVLIPTTLTILDLVKKCNLKMSSKQVEVWHFSIQRLFYVYAYVPPPHNDWNTKRRLFYSQWTVQIFLNDTSSVGWDSLTLVLTGGMDSVPREEREGEREGGESGRERSNSVHHLQIDKLWY